MAEVDLNAVLNLAVKEKASDVHIKAGLPPIFRINTRLVPIKQHPRLAPDEIARVALTLMNDTQKETFKNDHQVDIAHSVPGLGRFRVNIYKQRGAVSIVLRVIPMQIKSFEELHLPPVIERLANEMRGLILVTGITGSGKSTTLSAIIDYINNNRSSNIIAIEDPIEFLHRDKKSIISQREIGVDSNNFSQALKGALRQDPDVIMLGELRDIETIEIALTAAETGHLVLSTLHTIDALETVNRIVSVFPPYQQKQVRIQLAGVLAGVISQRLLPTQDGNGLVPAVEVLVTSSRIRECVEDKDKTKEIPDAIEKGHTTIGTQTFDQSLKSLIDQGFITFEEAIKQTGNADDFALKIKGGIETGSAGLEGDMPAAGTGQGGTGDGMERF